MEGMIATLVKDFEDGKMDRRQLIQCLALVAMAGPAAAAPQDGGCFSQTGLVRGQTRRPSH